MGEKCPVCGNDLVELGSTSTDLTKGNKKKDEQIEYYCSKCEIFISLP